MERDNVRRLGEFMYSYNEAISASLKYFNDDDLAASVFVGKYALQNEKGSYIEKDPNDMHRRLSSEFARVEKKYPNPMSESEIFELFENFKYIVPQGSPMSGIGNNFKVQSLSNCFVIESPHDSYGGILKTDQEQVQIMKRRGGVGFDISNIRPKGLNTSNAAKTTDGIEVFMDRFSNSCREVAQGGRRGALMLTISVHHPQIRDFIKIKKDLKRVTGANISIRLSEEFMRAVEGGDQLQLRFPVNSKQPDIKELVDAKELWHEIIESAHASAEPGLLFWDTAKEMTPSDIYEKEGFGSVSTNPCGEIILSPYDSCRLMLINLTSFVIDPWTENATFDYNKFADVSRKAQKLMDDMVDLEVEQVDKITQKIEKDPEPESVKKIELDLWGNIRKQALNGRRTGLGVTGLGDTVAMLGQKYGSDESIETTEKIYQWLTTHSYVSSMEMARDRGSFPIHSYKREENHPFLERIFDSIDSMPPGCMPQNFVNNARQYNKLFGRRNIANTTTAPAGSVSVLTQTTSGIEPAFMLHYTRRKKINPNDINASIDFIDDSGDKWQEYTVYHHGFKQWMKLSKAVPEEIISNEELVALSPYSFSTANEINWVSKVKMQGSAQKWICHAISNTTNLPSDADVETVKNVYVAGWKAGCKGVTVYRDGCRSGVLVSEKSTDCDQEDEEFRENMAFADNNAPKRPEVLSCEIHHATIQGEKWTILVGLLEGRPYEVIGGLSRYIEIPKKHQYGELKRRRRKTMLSKYDLHCGIGDDEFLIKDVVAVFDNPNHAGYTRTISLALRHGAPIQYVVEQLQKDKEADLFSFSKVIARCLKKYIPDGSVGGDKTCWTCGADDSLVYQEGCVTCKSCGASKCG
jgi:ribonucleoside-diphosphate reductase alpha chain